MIKHDVHKVKEKIHQYGGEISDGPSDYTIGEDHLTQNQLLHLFDNFVDSMHSNF